VLLSYARADAYNHRGESSYNDVLLSRETARSSIRKSAARRRRRPMRSALRLSFALATHASRGSGARGMVRHKDELEIFASCTARTASRAR
jgi:hypothetical protein